MSGRWTQIARIMAGLCPGVHGLWTAGRVGALALALGFAWSVNFLLFATFIGPLWVPDIVLSLGWTLLAFGSCYAAWTSYARRRAGSRGLPAAAGEQDLFNQAQAEYLRGHWFEAESLVERMIEHDTNDVEARLLLSSIYRRTKRLDDSRQQLASLERLIAGDRWRLEIEQERRLLDRIERSSSGTADHKELSQPKPEQKLTDAA